MYGFSRSRSVLCHQSKSLISCLLIVVLTPLVLLSNPAEAASSECDSGFGIYGTVTANGAPVAGATVVAKTVTLGAVNEEMLPSVRMENTSAPISTGADGGYEHCGVSTDGFNLDARLIIWLAVTPPVELYGPGQNEFGFTTHRFDVGPASENVSFSHDVSVGLVPAAAHGYVTDVNGVPIVDPDVTYGLRDYLAPDVVADVRVLDNGWFGIGSTEPNPFSQLPAGETPCWGCTNNEVRVGASGYMQQWSELTFGDVEPYAAWTKNLFAADPSWIVPEDEWDTYTFALRQLNLEVDVADAVTGAPVPNVVLEGYAMGQVDCGQQECWIWEMADDAGNISTALPGDGTWNLTIRTDFGGYAQERFTVVVSDGIVVGIGDADNTVVCGSPTSGDSGGYPPTTTTVPAPATTAAGGPTSALSNACDGTLSVALRPPNFLAIVRSGNGDAVPRAGVNVAQLTQHYEGWVSEEWIGWSNSASLDPQWGGSPDALQGQVGFSFRETGIYKLGLEPPWMSDFDVASTTIFLHVTTDADGDISNVDVCEQGEYPVSLPDCETNPVSLPTTLVEGVSYFDLPMRAPNLRLAVCASTPGSCIPAFAYASLEKFDADEFGAGGWWMHVGSGNSDGTGLMNLLVDSAGDYRLHLEDNHYEPGRTAEARTIIEFAATEVNGEIEFVGLGDADPDTGRFEVRFAEPSLRGRLVSPDDGATQRWAHIEVFRPSADDYCPSCREHVGWSSTNDDGEFALVLDEGQYHLRLNPSWEGLQSGLARTEVEITLSDCDNEGVLEVYSTGDSCGTELADETGFVTFTLAGVNFVGTLLVDESTQTPSGWTQGNVRVQTVDEWSGQTRWEWTDNWFNVREDGRFGVALLETGRYRVEFEPPYDGDSLVVKAVVELEVECTGTECTVAPTEELATDENGYVVYFGQPNVTGTLTLPDTGEPVSHTWINVEKWSTLHCWEGCYSWDESLDGVNANTRNDGQFGMQLEDGSYRLTFNPVEGYARSQIKILVDQEGTVCNQPIDTDGYPQTDATCESSDVPLDVQLLAPNLTGTVTGGETASRWSGIQFHIWNPDYGHWDWANIWANTNNAGAFSVRLETAGFYKATFEPEWNLTDYSAATKYVVICESGPAARIALVDTVDEGIAWECDIEYPTMATDVQSVVALVGANFIGRAEDQLGNGIGDVWIGLLNCDVDGGSESWCSWERGVNTRRIWGDPQNSESGRFGLTVVDSDTTDSEATRYELEVNPPWDNTQGFVRQRINIYAYSGWADGSSVCLEGGYDNSGVEPLCADGFLYDEGTPFTLVMSTGNIKGRVVTAEAACDDASPTNENCPGIANSWVEVQRWSTPEWDESSDWYHWQWEDSNTNTIQGHNDLDKRGNFGLNLTTDGLYRIVANPSWDNPDGYSRRTVLIRVAGDDWCVEPGHGNDFDYQRAEPVDAPCTPGENDNVADAVSGLTMRLVGSNLLGRLYRPSTDTTDDAAVAEAANKVGDVWVGLERSESYEWCSDTDVDGNLEEYCSSSWWNWMGGSSVPGGGSSKGNFALSITEAGTYRLRVDAPWHWDTANGGQLTSFTETFTVTGPNCTSMNDDPSLCTITFTDPNIVVDGERHLLTYPTPNVVGTLFSPNASESGERIPVGGSWISISNEQTGEWFNGVTTVRSGARKGEFSLLLEPPNEGETTYRLEFWPNWERPDHGTRRVVFVTVDSNGAVTSDGFEPGTQDVTLAGVTLRGTVYYKVDGQDTPMRYAWAEAERCISESVDACSQREWIDSRGTERDGSLQLGLEDGIYRIRVHPNWGLLATRSMELTVVIESEVMTSCEYAAGGSCMRTSDDGDVFFEPNFHHEPPNVRVEIIGETVTGDRYVALHKCAAQDCSITENVGTFLARYDAITGKATLDLALDFADNDYAVKVLARETEEIVGWEIVADPDDDLTSPTVQFALSAATP